MEDMALNYGRYGTDTWKTWPCHMENIAQTLLSTHMDMSKVKATHAPASPTFRFYN